MGDLLHLTILLASIYTVLVLLGYLMTKVLSHNYIRPSFAAAGKSEKKCVEAWHDVEKAHDALANAVWDRLQEPEMAGKFSRWCQSKWQFPSVNTAQAQALVHRLDPPTLSAVMHGFPSIAESMGYDEALDEELAAYKHTLKEHDECCHEYNSRLIGFPWGAVGAIEGYKPVTPNEMPRVTERPELPELVPTDSSRLPSAPGPLEVVGERHSQSDVG